MTKPSTFVAIIRKSGNSMAVTIPKGIADVWGLGNKVQITIEEVK